MMRGFTLAETIVVVAITALVGTAVSGLITYFYKSNAFLLQEVSAVDSAHRGLTNAFRALREASYGDDGAYPISSAATSTITFYSDTDGTGTVEKVRLYLSGGTFYEGITKSAGNPPSYTGQSEKINTIATYVTNGSTTPIFRYYNASGVQITTTPVDVSQVSSVGVSLNVDINPFRAPAIYTLSERATLRNLRAD